MKYYIKVFGCQQNTADAERLEQALIDRGMKKAKGYEDANYIVIVTCMVRQSAENRVYGLVENLSKIKKEKTAKGIPYTIVLTGCMVGLTFRDKKGIYTKKIYRVLKDVDHFMPIDEVGFDVIPHRNDTNHALLPISNGCNNFCTYCVVPFTRGKEVSRPYKEILKEAKLLKHQGYTSVTLLGQNVNSYGSDLILDPKTSEVNVEGKTVKPILVKHLGRYRIPTLFPYLLEDIAKLGFNTIDFISSNPWDFSDELIDVIAQNKNISRAIHLPVQSGDDSVLKRMNRWYTSEEYFDLISKIKTKIPQVKFTTDIIVGFCGETDEEFKNTEKLCRKVGFEQVYIGRYSPRPLTYASKKLKDDVPAAIKKKRWLILENLINKPNLKKNINHLFII